MTCIGCETETLPESFMPPGELHGGKPLCACCSEARRRIEFAVNKTGKDKRAAIRDEFGEDE